MSYALEAWLVLVTLTLTGYRKFFLVPCSGARYTFHNNGLKRPVICLSHPTHCRWIQFSALSVAHSVKQPSVQPEWPETQIAFQFLTLFQQDAVMMHDVLILLCTLVAVLSDNMFQNSKGSARVHVVLLHQPSTPSHSPVLYGIPASLLWRGCSSSRKVSGLTPTAVFALATPKAPLIGVGDGNYNFTYTASFFLLFCIERELVTCNEHHL
jgi:hypothetical protein